MARPPSREPTDGELEILRVLWEHGPSGLGTVREALRARREVATTTVATMLKVMLDKELVKRTKGARGYRWSARVTQRTTQRRLLKKLLSSAFDGSARGLLAHIVEDGNLTLEDWDEVRRLLDASAGRGRGGSKR